MICRLGCGLYVSGLDAKREREDLGKRMVGASEELNADLACNEEGGLAWFERAKPEQHLLYRAFAALAI